MSPWLHKRVNFFLSLQSLSKLPVMRIAFWFNAYSVLPLWRGFLDGEKILFLIFPQQLLRTLKVISWVIAFLKIFILASNLIFRILGWIYFSLQNLVAIGCYIVSGFQSCCWEVRNDSDSWPPVLCDLFCPLEACRKFSVSSVLKFHSDVLWGRSVSFFELSTHNLKIHII